MRAILKLSLVALALVALWALVPSDTGALTGPHSGFGGCTGCHTPHAASGGTVLLWGRTLSTKNFSWSDATATTLGTSLVNLLQAATKVTSGVESTKYCLSCHDGSVTNIPFGTQIGTGDLRGTHPVAVPYPFGGVANKYNGVTTANVAVGTAVSGKWVASPNQTKVKLFSDPTATAPNNRGIECASCHNPHDDVTFPPYLRDTITNSALCTNCHAN
ncbi:MAG TPA: cytochrome c3 family protein [Candidatus Methylomirabilis sp.]|nr:cytochrome c3 family protein [Candidatus Methylomirabilis sp.]HSC70732.1 cytochrome c3 family protein [Candidatus Methylomirabilis sp.]